MNLKRTWSIMLPCKIFVFQLVALLTLVRTCLQYVWFYRTTESISEK